MVESHASRRWVEALVIVGSILLAFAIQAVWDERQESAAAEELARGLIEDLDESLVDLQAVRESNARKLEASLKARDLLRSETPTVSLDSLNLLLRASGGTERLTPITRSYDQLVATGLLRRLDPTLRTAIAEWSQGQDYVREYYERDLLDFRQNVAFPFWTRSEVAFDQMLDGYRGLDFGPPRFPHTWRDLHQSRELNDVLATFAVLTVSVLREYDTLESASVELQTLLRARYGS